MSDLIKTDLSRAQFFTSSYSGNGNNCVEVAAVADVVGVRDSKDKGGPVLAFSAADWSAFVGGVKAGEFDRH